MSNCERIQNIDSDTRCSDKREYYELKAVNEDWAGRQPERQINSMLNEHLLMSNDKESVLSVARKEKVPETPLKINKGPIFLEFKRILIENNEYFVDLVFYDRLPRSFVILKLKTHQLTHLDLGHPSIFRFAPKKRHDGKIGPT